MAHTTWVLIVALTVSIAFKPATEADDHPQTLEIGSSAPDFHLSSAAIFSARTFSIRRAICT